MPGVTRDGGGGGGKGSMRSLIPASAPLPRADPTGWDEIAVGSCSAAFEPGRTRTLESERFTCIGGPLGAHKGHPYGSTTAAKLDEA